VEYDTNQQIRAIYNQGLGSFPHDVMALLKRKVTKLIDLPLAYKQQWIETSLLAQKQRVKQLAGPSQSEWKYMQTWAIQPDKNNTTKR